MSIQIAIADDHPLIINGLQRMISKYDDMKITDTYTNGAKLLEGLSKLRSGMQPDVLLLDIHMPEQSGDEVARIIEQRYPSIHMIALTNLDAVYHIKSMLQHGVLGYILKSTGEEILIQAIRTVSKGQQYLDADIAERLRQDNLSISRQAAHGTVLTLREKEVLRLIAANYTSQEIAEKLFVSKRTIDSHRLNLLYKLDVKNTAALIMKAMQMGLVE